MNKTLIALGLSAVVAMPALAMHQGPADQKQATTKASIAAPSRPHMLILFENVNYGGDSLEIEEEQALTGTGRLT